jgi:hypothetical protein
LHYLYYSVKEFPAAIKHSTLIRQSIVMVDFILAWARTEAQTDPLGVKQ